MSYHDELIDYQSEKVILDDIRTRKDEDELSIQEEHEAALENVLDILAKKGLKARGKNGPNSAELQTEEWIIFVSVVSPNATSIRSYRNPISLGILGDELEIINDLLDKGDLSIDATNEKYYKGFEERHAVKYAETRKLLQYEISVGRPEATLLLCIEELGRRTRSATKKIDK